MPSVESKPLPPSAQATALPGDAVEERRNPGPSWGYQFLRIADKITPEFIYRPMRAFGTLVAMTGMPEQRRHSRDYLRLILGREPRFTEVFRHFFAFEEALMLKLRVANGRLILCRYGQGEASFRRWMEEGGPVLLGSFHFGVSDMQGFQIATTHRRPIHIVRRKVGNSHDTERLRQQFGDLIKFIWVNDPQEMLFALKDAAATDEAIAMKCDRLDGSMRSEVFRFLGARRRFPFTIYHLAFLFRRPVLLSVGVRSGTNGTIVHSSPCFEPVEGETRAAAMARARVHFQGFLDMVEGLLREDPYRWFNFIPLNPEVRDPEEAA